MYLARYMYTCIHPLYILDLVHVLQYLYIISIERLHVRGSHLEDYLRVKGLPSQTVQMASREAWGAYKTFCEGRPRQTRPYGPGFRPPSRGGHINNIHFSRESMFGAQRSARAQAAADAVANLELASVSVRVWTV